MLQQLKQAQITFRSSRVIDLALGSTGRLPREPAYAGGCVSSFIGG